MPMSEREHQGRDWERPEYERERERQSYGREQSGYGWERQHDYPWGQQGQEGYFGGGQHTGRGPKGYQRSDERIREDICERLTQHSAIDAGEIEVEVKNCE